MNRILGLSLVLFALLLIPLGCGGDPRVTGKWALDTAAMKKLFLEEKTAGMPDDKKEELAANPMIKGLFDQMKMEMELNADGTCTGSAAMGNESDTTSGTWEMEGDVLAVSMTAMAEENPEVETLRFKVNGDTLEVIHDEANKAAGTPVFVFTRK
jgi:hypothetical protein